jgi:hypothetical protein
VKLAHTLRYAAIGTACLLAPVARGTVAWLTVRWMGLAAAVLAMLYAVTELGMHEPGAALGAQGAPAALLRAVLLPYRAVAGLVLAVRVLLSREAPEHEVVPGLLLGRRPLVASDRSRLERAGVGAVVDLCAEFGPSRSVLGLAPADALRLPALDGTAPSRRLLEAVAWIEERLARGQRILIHCAAGHGRSATVVAGVLLARMAGLAPDRGGWRARVPVGAAEARDALARVAACRPRVRLNRGQHDVLIAFAGALERIARATAAPEPAAASRDGARR